MLSDCKVYATIPASDIDRAIGWYEDKLGLTPAMRTGDGAMYEGQGGTGFLIYPTPHAGQAPQTVMSFTAEDAVAEIRDLKARGVVFEEYDLPDIRTVDSIATMPSGRGGWFKDSEGNIIGIFEFK